MKLSRILFTVAFLSCGPAYAETLQGRVIGISDGETVTVLDSSNLPHKIRLMGIDAPEKNQAFGTKSKDYLSRLIYGKKVLVEYHKKDRYGRTIGKIIVNGTDANLEQVKSGMAWHYKQYQKMQTSEDRDAYASAEIQARAEMKGLWHDANPMSPWEFRKQHKSRK